MVTTTQARQRVAIVIYEDAAKDLARAYRGLMTAVEFLDAGDDVTVVYDGSGVDTLAAASSPAWTEIEEPTMSTLHEPSDLLVIGGGTAGIVGTTTGARVDLTEVLTHVRATISAIEPQDSPDALRSAGVVVLHGTARFTGPTSVEVDGHEHPFHQVRLATGGTPAVPPVPRLVESGPLTSDTVWELTTLPEHPVVMGGGSIGCEPGQAFARSGARVTPVEEAPRLMPREDPDAAASRSTTVASSPPSARPRGRTAGPRRTP